jgi:hypothetical protein
MSDFLSQLPSPLQNITSTDQGLPIKLYWYDHLSLWIMVLLIALLYNIRNSLIKKLSKWLLKRDRSESSTDSESDAEHADRKDTKGMPADA